MSPRHPAHTTAVVVLHVRAGAVNSAIGTSHNIPRTELNSRKARAIEFPLCSCPVSAHSPSTRCSTRPNHTWGGGGGGECAREREQINWGGKVTLKSHSGGQSHAISVVVADRPGKGTSLVGDVYDYYYFAEMYVNVVFVIRCLYSAVSLTLVKK